MMMSGKDFLNRHVLSWRRKVYSDWEDITSSGRAFQVFGPATGKARLPTVDRVAEFIILSVHIIVPPLYTTNIHQQVGLWSAVDTV